MYVGADATAGKVDWTADEAAKFVDKVCIGVEVASSPLATLNDLGPGAVISDSGNNWGVIAGAEIPDWRTRKEDLAVETFIGGKSVGRGNIAIPATPLAALAFALNKAAQQGLPLRKGDYISTGMITGVLLAIARISGETAPLLFTALNNQFWSTNLNAPMASLPVVIFQFALSPYADWQRLAWAGALIITFTVLALSIAARWIGASRAPK